MIISDRRYRRNFTLKGEVYDLSHLQPFAIDIKIRSCRTVAMRFEFSTHVFTEKHNSTIPPDHNIYDKTAQQQTQHHMRTFHPERYMLSKTLPDILRSITGKTLAQTTPFTKGGFLVQVKSHNRHYHIFFNMYRRKNTAIFYVKSAYCKPHRLTGKTKQIKDFLIDKGF